MNAQIRAVNVAEMLAQTARRLPEATAVVHGETRWTWRMLDEAADRVRAELRRRGVRRGDCVLLHGHNSPSTSSRSTAFGEWGRRSLRPMFGSPLRMWP